MDPYGQQQRDGKNREQETDNTKVPIGEISMIADELTACGLLRSPKNSFLRKIRKVLLIRNFEETLKNFHPWDIKHLEKYY